MKNKKLNRDSQSRIALFKGQISSLIAHEEITTTAGKASVLKSLFEKMLTKARTGSVPARRQIQSYIEDNALVKKIVDDIAPRYAGVKGGYTKTVMVGNRKGDGAPLVKITLTKKAAIETKDKEKKVAPAIKPNTASRKTTAQAVSQSKSPKIVKPTKLAQVAGSSVGKVRKTGER